MTQQLLLDVLPAPRATLDNYIVGKNQAAVDALQNCQPGRAIYLWGPPGAGRTHLLKAVSIASNAFYFGADQPAVTLKEIANADKLTFKTIAVDNVELLNPDAQAALFALYNRWRQAATSKQAFALLVAGNHAPVAMPLREDLRTRLGWDLVFRLELLSDIDRAQVLKAQANERGLPLSSDVISWILTHYARDMRLLIALLDALDRYSLEKHRAITLPLLKDLLATTRTTNTTNTTTNL